MSTKQATSFVAFLCEGCGDVHLQMLNGRDKVISFINMDPSEWDKMVLAVEQQRALKAQDAANRIRI